MTEFFLQRVVLMLIAAGFLSVAWNVLTERDHD